MIPPTVKISFKSFILLTLLALASCGGGGGGNSADTEAPSVPANLTLTVVSDSRIDLSWNKSTDNTGVSGYRVFRDSTELTTTLSTSWSDTALTADTAYCYKISAFDAAGNESALTTQVCTTTDSSPSVWTVSTLDTAGDVGLSTSVATGSVHISYYDSDNNQLKYKRNETGIWSSPVPLVGIGGISLATTFSALALDSQGNLFITFYDASSVLDGDLKIITCQSASDCLNTSNWTSVLIDSTGDIGSDTSIAVDLSDNIHISYYDSDNGFLKYAYCQAGSNCNIDSSWTASTVDISGDVGQYSSITTGSDNIVRISYYESTALFAGSLKHAFCDLTDDCTDSANWSKVTIDATADAGQFSSIVSDSSSNIHISYYDFDKGNLKYASCPADSSCSQTSDWDITTIDSASDVGDYSSITADYQDNLHISYHDFNSDSLKYASCQAAADCSLAKNWELIVVDDGAGVGEFSSIATDAEGNVHISYYDSANGDLKYAVKQ